MYVRGIDVRTNRNFMLLHGCNTWLTHRKMSDNASGPSGQRLALLSHSLQPTMPARKSPAKVYRSLAGVVRPSAIPLHLVSAAISPPKALYRPISTTSPKTPPPNEPPAELFFLYPPSTLPHLTPTSEIHIISTSSKRITHRFASAIGYVRFANPEPLRLIREHGLTKGDVLAVARVAGIQAVKKTGEIIPLAHSSIPIEGCVVRVEPVDSQSPAMGSLSEESAAEVASRKPRSLGLYGSVRITVSVETTAKTGIEMEALTGVMGAALTIVDMCKGVDKYCVITGVRVVSKQGGRTDWGSKESEGDTARVDDPS